MSDAETVASFWDQMSEGTFSEAVYWCAHPAVAERYHRRACAGREEYQHWVDLSCGHFLGDRRPLQSILSIGCGDGDLERHLCMLNAATSIHGVDISPVRIERAAAKAREAGMDQLSYSVVDVETEDFPDPPYDAIFFDSSLHHLSRLEEVLLRCATHLAPDGLLFVNEYVGPNRFAFSEREIEILRSAFKLLPASHRVSLANDQRTVLEEPVIPDPVEVARVDPSESVRSADILDLIPRYFEVVELNELGGAILHIGLSHIAGNFGADPTSRRLLDMLFRIEDDLMAAGELSTHFVFLVARPR